MEEFAKDKKKKYELKLRGKSAVCIKEILTCQSNILCLLRKKESIPNELAFLDDRCSIITKHEEHYYRVQEVADEKRGIFLIKNFLENSRNAASRNMSLQQPQIPSSQDQNISSHQLQRLKSNSNLSLRLSFCDPALSQIDSKVQKEQFALNQEQRYLKQQRNDESNTFSNNAILFDQKQNQMRNQIGQAQLNYYPSTTKNRDLPRQIQGEGWLKIQQKQDSLGNQYIQVDKNFDQKLLQFENITQQLYEEAVNIPQDHFNKGLLMIQYYSRKSQANQEDQESYQMLWKEIEHLLVTVEELKIQIPEDNKVDFENLRQTPKSNKDHSLKIVENTAASLIKALNNIDVARILNAVKDTEQKLLEVKDQDVIMFIGETGSGKTMTILHLAQANIQYTEVQSKGGSKRKDYVNIDPKFKDMESNAFSDSVTQFFRPVPINLGEYEGQDFSRFHNKIVLVDGPGFNDTKGLTYDISSSISQYKILCASKTVRLVALQSFINQKDRQQGLQGLAQLIEKFFKNISEEQLKSVYYAFTKYYGNEKFNISHYIESLIERVEKENPIIKPQYLKVLDDMRMKVSQETDENFRSIDIDVGNPGAILQRILSTQAIKYPREQFKEGLSQDCILALKEYLAKRINLIIPCSRLRKYFPILEYELIQLRKLAHLLSNLKFLGEGIQQIVQSIKNEYELEAKSLMEILSQQISDSSNLHEETINQYKEFVRNIRKIQEILNTRDWKIIYELENNMQKNIVQAYELAFQSYNQKGEFHRRRIQKLTLLAKHFKEAEQFQVQIQTDADEQISKYIIEIDNEIIKGISESNANKICEILKSFKEQTENFTEISCVKAQLQRNNSQKILQNLETSKMQILEMNEQNIDLDSSSISNFLKTIDCFLKLEGVEQVLDIGTLQNMKEQVLQKVNGYFATQNEEVKEALQNQDKFCLLHQKLKVTNLLRENDHLRQLNEKQYQNSISILKQQLDSQSKLFQKSLTKFGQFEDTSRSYENANKIHELLQTVLQDKMFDFKITSHLKQYKILCMDRMDDYRPLRAKEEEILEISNIWYQNKKLIDVFQLEHSIFIKELQACILERLKPTQEIKNLLNFKQFSVAYIRKYSQLLRYFKALSSKIKDDELRFQQEDKQISDHIKQLLTDFEQSLKLQIDGITKFVCDNQASSENYNKDLKSQISSEKVYLLKDLKIINVQLNEKLAERINTLYQDSITIILHHYKNVRNEFQSQKYNLQFLKDGVNALRIVEQFDEFLDKQNTFKSIREEYKKQIQQNYLEFEAQIEVIISRHEFTQLDKFADECKQNEKNYCEILRRYKARLYQEVYSNIYKKIIKAIDELSIQLFENQQDFDPKILSEQILSSSLIQKIIKKLKVMNKVNQIPQIFQDKALLTDINYWLNDIKQCFENSIIMKISDFISESLQNYKLKQAKKTLELLKKFQLSLNAEINIPMFEEVINSLDIKFKEKNDQVKNVIKDLNFNNKYTISKFKKIRFQNIDNFQQINEDLKAKISKEIEKVKKSESSFDQIKDTFDRITEVIKPIPILEEETKQIQNKLNKLNNQYQNAICQTKQLIQEEKFNEIKMFFLSLKRFRHLAFDELQNFIQASFTDILYNLEQIIPGKLNYKQQIQQVKKMLEKLQKANKYYEDIQSTIQTNHKANKKSLQEQFDQQINSMRGTLQNIIQMLFTNIEKRYNISFIWSQRMFSVNNLPPLYILEIQSSSKDDNISDCLLFLLEIQPTLMKFIFKDDLLSNKCKKVLNELKEIEDKVSTFMGTFSHNTTFDEAKQQIINLSFLKRLYSFSKTTQNFLFELDFKGSFTYYDEIIRRISLTIEHHISKLEQESFEDLQDKNDEFFLGFKTLAKMVSFAHIIQPFLDKCLVDKIKSIQEQLFVNRMKEIEKKMIEILESNNNESILNYSQYFNILERLGKEFRGQIEWQQLQHTKQNILRQTKIFIQDSLRNAESALSEQKIESIALKIIDIDELGRLIPSLKDIVKTRTSEFLDSIKNQLNGDSQLLKIKRILKQRGQNKLILLYHQLTGQTISQYNKKFKDIKIDTYLENYNEVKASKNDFLTYLNKYKCSNRFEQVLFAFDGTLNNFLEKTNVSEQDKNKIANEIITHVNFLIKEHSFSHLQFTPKLLDDLPYVIGKIFALWSLEHFHYYLDADGSESEKKSFLWRPHPGQIVAVLRMLSVGDDYPNRCEYIDKNNQTKNALVPNIAIEMQTGEGKSVVIAILACVFSLLNIQTSCVCYSEYLCKRDFNIFQKLFIRLNLEELVKYSTFDDLTKYVFQDKDQLEDGIKSFLEGRDKNEIEFSQRSKEQAKILLVDEFDVFFQDRLYSNLFMPSIILKNNNVLEFMKCLWFNYRKETNFAQLCQEESFKQMIDSFPNYQGKEEFLKNIVAKIYKKAITFNVDKANYENLAKQVLNGTANCNQISDLVFASLNEIQKNPHCEKEVLKFIGLEVIYAKFLFKEIPLQFDKVIGISGTLQTAITSEKNDIFGFYEVNKIGYLPSVFGEKRLSYEIERDFQILQDKVSQRKRLMEELKIVCKNYIPIVIFCETAQLLEDFYPSEEEMIYLGEDLIFQKLLQEDEQLNEILDKSIKPHVITFATSYFQRGTDFTIFDEKVNNEGGMTIISTYYCKTESDEKQLQGRTARFGYIGRFIYILNSKDLLQKGFLEVFSGENNNALQEILTQLCQGVNKLELKLSFIKQISERRRIISYQSYDEIMFYVNENESRKIILNVDKYFKQEADEVVLQYLNQLNFEDCSQFNDNEQILILLECTKRNKNGFDCLKQFLLDLQKQNSFKKKIQIWGYSERDHCQDTQIQNSNILRSSNNYDQLLKDPEGVLKQFNSITQGSKDAFNTLDSGLRMILSLKDIIKKHFKKIIILGNYKGYQVKYVQHVKDVIQVPIKDMFGTVRNKIKNKNLPQIDEKTIKSIKDIASLQIPIFFCPNEYKSVERLNLLLKEAGIKQLFQVNQEYKMDRQSSRQAQTQIFLSFLESNQND